MHSSWKILLNVSGHKNQESIKNRRFRLVPDFKQWSTSGWVLFGFGCYIATSYFFLQFPQLLHRVKRLPASLVMRHSSHRGGASERPENTIIAFRHAVSLGSQLLELDVYKTKDGVPVVVHDANLIRLTGQSLDVRQTNYSDLPPLQTQIDMPFPFNPVYGKCIWSHEVARIPTLKEVFENFPTSCINIDCKQHDEDLARQVEKLIVDHKMEDRVIWGSAHNNMATYMFSLNSRIPRFFSVKQILYTVFKYCIGILPFCPIRENVFEIPIFTATFNENIRRVASESRTRRFFGWVFITLSNAVLSSKGLFRHLQKRGIKVVVWVANEDIEFERAYKILGVDGVMTDYPTRLTNYLSHHDPAFYRFNNKQK